MTSAKLEEEKECSTPAWHESWRLLPFTSYEDHETSPSVVETERISNENWQCWDHFTWPLSSKGDQIYFFVLLGGQFLYFLRIIVNSWILKIFMIWLVAVTFFLDVQIKPSLFLGIPLRLVPVYTYRKENLSEVNHSEFSQTEHSHIISTQIKIQNIPEASMSH